MIRYALVLAVSLTLQARGAADENEAGHCVILNTTDHPIVIGLYRAAEGGVNERLVKVASKTQVRGVPVDLSTDSQFAVAYEAISNDGEIERSKPIVILGQAILVPLKSNPESKLPDVLIEYRGGKRVDPRGRGFFSDAFRVPAHEAGAASILRSANFITKEIENSLSMRDYIETVKP